MKWFLAGLGVGVALGVVMAPARGVESRRRLRETANQAWDDMSEEARATLDEMRSSDWARQARDTANQARERVRDLKRSAQENLSELRDRAPDTVQRAMDRVASAATTTNHTTTEDSNPSNGNGRASLLELLNEGSQDELIAVNGIGPVLALKIVQHRPYKDEQQALEEKVVPPSAFEALRNHIKRPA
jgi:DNA uptake protein ComE-like DNA-binding protein